MLFKTYARRKEGSFLFTLILIFLFPVFLYPDQKSVTSPAFRDFQLGVYYYEHGDYATAITYLTGSLLHLEKPQKKKALELLGIIYFIKGDKQKSRYYFSKLLDIDADYSLDPLFVPPEIVLFFNEIRKQKQSILTTVTPPEPKRSLFITTVKRGARFLPFGIGYAVEGKSRKALIFGIIEGFLIVTNISLYYYRRCALKPCSDKYYPPDRIGEAKTLQTIQLITGYIWISLWGYNIVDILEGE